MCLTCNVFVLQCLYSCMHPLMDGFEVTKMGDDDSSFKLMCDTVASGRPASYVSLMMLNPLTADLPPIAIDAFPTCNSFDSEFVRWHWERVTELVNTKMAPLGLSVQGCATDGDARRYKIQKEVPCHLTSYHTTP